MTKLGKFFKRLDKMVFWIDFEKIKESRFLLIVFVLSFIAGLMLGPLGIIFIIGFIRSAQ